MSHDAHIPIVNLDNTLGPLLIGALLSMALWGVTCAQTYDYFMENTDGRLQRSIVALLWMVDTFSSAVSSHVAYHYLITNHGKGFQTVTWSMDLFSLVSGISNFIIRSMFARRVYQFGRRSVIFPTSIMILSICDLVAVTIATAKALGGINTSVLKDITKLLYTSFAFGVTADLAVTIALSWLLQSAKSGFRKSDSIVNTLMAYVVHTGCLVTILATVALATYAAMPNNLIFTAFVVLQGKLYVNAYLATLNARVRLREKNSDSSIPLSRLGGSSSNGRVTSSMIVSNDDKAKSPMAISFQKTVERRVDDASNEVKRLSQVV